MINTLALDPGYGNMKLYGPNGSLLMQSLVATNGKATLRDTSLTRQRVPLLVSIDNHEFYVGENAHNWGRPVETLDFDRFVGSPEMKALFYGVLTKYQREKEFSLDNTINLIVGLPISVLSGEEKEVTATRRAVKRFFSGEHQWQVGDEKTTITIGEVRIAAQAVGSLFDYLLQDDGTMILAKKLVFQDETGVINVGFNTLDLLAVLAGRIQHRFTSGDVRGVRRLLELFNDDGIYSLGELDAKLRRGTLDLSGALDIWQREVMGFVEKKWGKRFKGFKVIVAVGGGAILLRRVLQDKFGTKIWFPDEPVMATARGLYKYVLMKENKNG